MSACFTLFSRQGHSSDIVKRLLAPVSSFAVGARMAGNIARSSIRSELDNGLEDSAFWMTIRTYLEGFPAEGQNKAH